MIIRIDKSFEKDASKVKDKSLLHKIALCIESIQNAKDISEIKSLKKLKGYNLYYRIRVGDYRLGIVIENNTIDFVRCLHRKDIYKYFPK